MRYLVLIFVLSGSALAQGSFGVNLLQPVGPPPGPGENAYLQGHADGPCYYGPGITMDGPAQLPVNCMYTGMDGTPAPGSTIDVTGSASLTSALSSVVCGQHIRIHVANGPYGATTFPVKNCNAGQWIWVETDQLTNPNFPPEGTQATPCLRNEPALMYYPQYPCPNPAQLLAQFMCTTFVGNCVTVATGADHYRFIGLDVWCNPNPTINITGACVKQDGTNHIIWDRSLIHGQTFNCPNTIGGNVTCLSGDVDNGISSPGASYNAVVNGWVYDITNPQGSTTETHGIGLGGNGTVNGAEDVKKIYNVLIAASGEAWFSGGGGPGNQIQVYPARDIEIRHVRTFKPVSWLLCVQGTGGTGCQGRYAMIKNNGEFKNIDRVLIEGWVCENNWIAWGSDQFGYCSLLTPKNQSSAATLSSTSDSTGTVLTGTFPADVVSQYCATPYHCHITFNNIATQAQTWTSTSITVSPAVTPNFTGTSTKACHPGLNPWAATTNVTYRYADIRNSKNGFQLGAGTSDCGDSSHGVDAISFRNVLFEGINWQLNNLAPGVAGNAQQCFEFFNGNSPSYPLANFQFNHVTCAQAQGHSGSNSGLDYMIDASDQGTGSGQVTQRVQINSIGPLGALPGYKAGAIMTGGMNAGIVRSSGTSWTFTRNVYGSGVWPGQNTGGLPLPPTNADPTANPPGTGCNAAQATCVPNGAAFTDLFVQYNGPNGEPGYLGDYRLRPGSAYANAATDGGPIGVDFANWDALMQGLWTPSTLPTPTVSITTTSFAPAIQSVPYQQNLSGVSASPMQQWWLSSGTLPTGITLGVCGGTWCLAGTTSVAPGSFPIQLTMMDGLQRYTTASFTLTVNAPFPPTATCGSPGVHCIATCSRTDVAAAVTSAVDGDTIILPVCTNQTPGLASTSPFAGTPASNEWTSTLTITKRVNLIGQGVDQSVIISSLTGRVANSSNQDMIHYNLPLTDNNGMRISDFSVVTNINVPVNTSAAEINVVSGLHGLRIDHLKFYNQNSSDGAIWVDGDEWGVIDHVTADGPNMDRVILMKHNSWQGVGVWGENSWAQPSTRGTAQAMYAEDVTMLGPGPAGIWCEYGCRGVARHNIVGQFPSHGNDSNQRQRGVRVYEVYDNTARCVAGTGPNNAISFVSSARGGSAIIFENQIQTNNVAGCYPSTTGMWNPRNFRRFDGWVPYLACDGTGPFDKNDPALYGSGVADATSSQNNLVVLPSPAWTVDHWVGYSILNMRPGSWQTATGPWSGYINSNTANTADSANGFAKTWNAGDAWQIRRPYACIDQVGSGYGAYISGGANISASPTSCTAGGGTRAPICVLNTGQTCVSGTACGWPSQEKEPMYSWLNTRGVDAGTQTPVRAVYPGNGVRDKEDVYDDTNSGVLVGLLSARPTTCARNPNTNTVFPNYPGDAFWATDTRTLYVCTAVNTWTQWYKPYTYPHPLVGLATFSQNHRMIETGDGYILVRPRHEKRRRK